MLVSWLAILLLGFLLLGGMAGVIALLANRHTRGTTIGLLSFGSVALLLLTAVLFWVRSGSVQQASITARDHQAAAQRQALFAQADALMHQASASQNHRQAEQSLQQAAQTLREAERLVERAEISPNMNWLREQKQNEAQWWDKLAERAETLPAEQAEIAENYRNNATQARAEANQFGTGMHSSTNNRMTFGFFLSPVVLLVGAAIVFMAFKHGGTAVGLTAVALPLLLIGFSFVSYSNVQRTSHSQPAAASVALSQSDFRDARVHSESQAIDDLFAQAERNQRAFPKVRVSTGEIVTENFTQKVPVDSVRIVATNSDTAIIDNPPIPNEPIDNPPAGDDPPLAEEPTPDSPAVAAVPSSSRPATKSQPQPAKTPDWVTRPPKSVPHVYRRVVQSSWFENAETSHQRIGGAVDQAVHQYIQELAGEQSPGAYVPPLDSLGIGPRYIRENILKEQFYETRDFEHQSGMVNLHQLLEFDNRVSEDLSNRWREYARQGRVAGVAALSGSVLALLAGVLGLIKLDTYTKGFYTKRLFIGVPAAIIGFILIVALLEG